MASPPRLEDTVLYPEPLPEKTANNAQPDVAQAAAPLLPEKILQTNEQAIAATHELADAAQLQPIVRDLDRLWRNNTLPPRRGTI